MNATDRDAPLALTITSVERDTGLPKDTLRIWERRYGFPAPARDTAGERLYPLEQVEKLRLLKRLIDAGHRPGKVARLSRDELQRLLQLAGTQSARSFAPAQTQDDLDGLITLLVQHRVDELRGRLSQILLRRGLAPFVVEIVAELNEAVGNAWNRGRLQVFEEHLYTELMQGLLRNALGSIPRSVGQPSVLLTTFPQEPHGLGLLMAEAIFALEGCRCASLGVQTPLLDIVRAAQAQGADVVALSFSSAISGSQALEGLAELRLRIEPAVELWAGGNCAALHRRTPPGVLALRNLDDIAPAVQRWRQARGEGSDGGGS